MPPEILVAAPINVLGGLTGGPISSLETGRGSLEGGDFRKLRGVEGAEP